MSFKKSQLKFIVEALEELNLTPTERGTRKLIPIVLAGCICMSRKLVQGKTHTFLLPIFQQLDETGDSVQAVITAPSRELHLNIPRFARLQSPRCRSSCG